MNWVRTLFSKGLLLIISVFLGRAGYGQEEVVKTASSLDSLQLNAVLTLEMEYHGCYEKQHYNIKFKRDKDGIAATMHEYRDEAAFETHKIDRTFSWRKLTDEQIQSIRQLEVELKALATKGYTYCVIQNIFTFRDKARRRSAVYQVCDAEAFNAMRKAIFPQSKF